MSNNPIVFFCGSFYHDDDIEVLMRNSKMSLSWANNTLQWAFIKGFDGCYPKIEYISLAQIGAYPFRYRKVIYQGKKVYIGKNTINYLSFIDISLIKYISQYVRLKQFLYQRLRSLRFSVDKEIIVYVYDLNIPIIQAAVKLKQKYSNVKLGVIVPDLPSYTGERNYLYRKYLQFQEYKLKQIYASVDFYVLISEHMREKISIPDNKWIRIEGIYNPKIRNENIPVNKEKSKCILYSGAVSIRNGIVNLMDAFVGISQENYKLFICGVGDAENIVLEYAKNDDRIEYMGQILQSEVLSLQRQATLLVNPRTSELDFSRYSFPSKIMEYFSSGTPTLMYKVDGIPEEYYQYCYCIDDLSVNALRDAIVHICEKEDNELDEKGLIAKNFIESAKNPKVQCSKIYQFVKTIDS